MPVSAADTSECEGFPLTVQGLLHMLQHGCVFREDTVLALKDVKHNTLQNSLIFPFPSTTAMTSSSICVTALSKDGDEQMFAWETGLDLIYHHQRPFYIIYYYKDSLI